MSWTEETFERLRDAAPEPLVSRMRVDHSMILNVVNQPRRRGRDDARADGGQPRGRARARAALRAGRGARRRARRRRRPGVAARARRRRPHAAARRRRCRRTSRSTSRWRRSRSSRSSCSTRSPRRTRSTCVSVVEAILDDPFPVLMAQANKARGEAVAEMKAEGIEYDERMELLEEVTYPKPLAEPLRGRAPRLPRDAPVGARVRPLAEVGRARHVRAGPHVHRVRRALRPRALGGPRAALPQRRLPRAAPDGARARSRPTSSTRSSSGSARRSARPTRACSTSGRR